MLLQLDGASITSGIQSFAHIHEDLDVIANLRPTKK